MFTIDDELRPSVEVAIEDATVAIDYDGTDDTFADIVGAIEGQGYEVAE